MSDDLMIPANLDRRAELGQVCAQCGTPAEFGYKIEGAMQWFCDKHKISQNFADERLPKPDVSESKQPTNDELKDELAGRAEHIRKVLRCLTEHAVEHIIIIGRNLVEAREVCPHGEWLPWLKREFGWSQSTADRFMQVYRKRDEITHSVGNLDIGLNAVYLLAAPSTPSEACQDIKELVESGERVTAAKVKDAIAKARKPRASTPASTPDPPPPIQHKLIASGLTVARQMSLATLDQFIRGLRQIRREKMKRA